MYIFALLTVNEKILDSILDEKPKFKMKMVSVVFIGPPRGGKSSLLRSIVGHDPPEVSASTDVIKISPATLKEGCITTILASYQNQKLETLTTKESIKRSDLTRFLNFVHAAQMHARKQTVKKSEPDIEDKKTSEATSGESNANPETLIKSEPDIEDKKTSEATSNPNPAHENKEHSEATPDVEVIDIKENLKSLREDGVIDRIFNNEDEIILVNLFDTGGQPEFMELLPHVLSARDSIFVMCFKGSEPLNERYLVKYVADAKEGECLDAKKFTTLSPVTTEETIFQCIFSANLLSSSKFDADTKAVFVATHKDQTTCTEQRKRIQDNLTKMGLLGSTHVENVKFFEVCTERETQLLTMKLNDYKNKKVSDLFVPDQASWVVDNVVPTCSWLKCIKWDDEAASLMYVGDDDVNLKPVLKVLEDHKDKRVRDLVQYTGVSRVHDVLCDMIQRTETKDIELSDYMLYLGLAYRPAGKTGDIIVRPIVTLSECTRLAVKMECIPSDLPPKEKQKKVHESLLRLENDLHLVKYRCNKTASGVSGARDFKVTDLDLVICDPNTLYKKMSEIVSQCYLNPEYKNRLRRDGVLDRENFRDTFEGTLQGIKEAYIDCTIKCDQEKMLKMLLKFLNDHRVLMYCEESKLIYIPSALRAYPTEIIPMGKNVIVPSLLLARKKEYLPLGVLTTLMTSSEKQWECNGNKVLWDFCHKGGLFRNKVKYLVDNCIYVTLVARATCIEIRIEKSDDFFKPKQSTFMRVRESLKSELRNVLGESCTVDFETYLVCPRDPNHFAEYVEKDDCKCLYCGARIDTVPDCSVWFSDNVSAERLKCAPSAKRSPDRSRFENSKEKIIKLL